MSLIKSKKEIVILREAGRRLAVILNKVAEEAVPGAKSSDLDKLAEKLIRQGGDHPALLNYHPFFADRAYPATICMSVNNVVVHGIPTEGEVTLKEGDIVGLDLVLQHEGLFVDMAMTVGVGKIDAEADKLIKTTEKALYKGIEAVRAGGHIGDIGAAIEKVGNKEGYGIVRELGGHGVGNAVHEMPHIPNYGKKGRGQKLEAGMVLAIEPMFNEGSEKVVLEKDGYTYRTADGGRSAHFEHTIVVNKGGAEVLTSV